MIKEKTESVKADLYDLQSKAQTRVEKAQKGLLAEMESYRSANSRRIDETSE